jgi:hypothetical protein
MQGSMIGTPYPRMTTMALPEWMRTSVDAISLAQRLRRTGRQDLIDAVERGDTSLEAAVEQAEREQKPPPTQRRQPARRARLRQCQTDSIEGRGLPLRQLASRATGKPTDRQISRNTTGRPGGAGGLGRIMRLEPARRLSVLRARCRSVRGSVAISSASRVRSAVEASGNADQHRHGVHHQSNIRR